MTEKSDQTPKFPWRPGQKMPTLGGGRRPSFLPEDKHPDWKKKEETGPKDQKDQKD